MAGQLGEHRAPVGLVDGLDGPPDGEVQTAPGERRDGLLDGVPDEGVGEVVDERRGRDLGEQPGRRPARSTGGFELAGGHVGGQREHLEVDPLAGQRRRDRRGGGRSATGARAASATTSRTLSGTLAGRRRAAHDPALVGPGHGARAHEVAPELTEVEGVAAAAVGDAGGQPPQVVVERLAGGRGDEPLDGVDVEAAEPQPGGAVDAAQVGEAARQRLGDLVAGVAERADDEQPAAESPTCARCRSSASVWVPAQCRSSSTTSVGQRAAASVSTAMKASYRR